MAIYVYSGGDNSDGTSWTKAYQSITNAAVTGAAAGSVIYVASDQVENYSSGTMTLGFSNATPANPIKILSINRTSNLLEYGAMINTTGTNELIVQGSLYHWGMHYEAATGSTGRHLRFTYNNSGSIHVFDNCTLEAGHTGTNYGIVFNRGADSGFKPLAAVLRNCEFCFNAAGQSVYIAGDVKIFGQRQTYLSDTNNTQLFAQSTRVAGSVEVHACDLSNLTNYLVNLSQETDAVTYRFINCRLGSLSAIYTGTSDSPDNAPIYLENCDSAANNYRIAYANYQGDITSNTTCYLNAPYSLKMVSNANCRYVNPLLCTKIAQWNTSVGVALKATVEILSNATLKDDEIWVEIEYLSSSSYPVASVDLDDKYTDTLDSIINWPTAQGANQDSSTAGWVDGVGSQTKQKLVCTSFTPNMAGYVIARVYLAKASQTVYVDPYLKIEVA